MWEDDDHTDAQQCGLWHRCLVARASQGKLPRRLEEYSSDAPKGASEPAQSLSRLSLDRATVIPLDQASFLLSGPCQSPSRSPRGLWVMAFDWLPECICSLCLNLAGGMRPRISKGVIQAGLSHSGHDRNPLGRKSQMLGRKEANRSFPSETAFSSIFPQIGYSPSCQPPNREESGQILQDLCYLSIFLACGKLTGGPTWTTGLPLTLGIKWLKTMKRELGQGKTQIVPRRSSPLKKITSQSREPILSDLLQPRPSDRFHSPKHLPSRSRSIMPSNRETVGRVQNSTQNSLSSENQVKARCAQSSGAVCVADTC